MVDERLGKVDYKEEDLKKDAEKTMVMLVAEYYQTQLRFKSELEAFRFKASQEENFLIPPTNLVTMPRKCKFERKLDAQFSTATDGLKKLLYSLTGERQIFEVFSTKFLDKYLDDCVANCQSERDFSEAKTRLDSFFELLVHRLLVDITNEVQDWRVVEVQRNIIQH